MTAVPQFFYNQKILFFYLNILFFNKLASRSVAKKNDDQIKLEQLITGHSDSLSKDKNNKILEQMDKSVFNILKEKSTGTGFLCLLPFPDRFNLLPVLISCFRR